MGATDASQREIWHSHKIPDEPDPATGRVFCEIKMTNTAESLFRPQVRETAMDKTTSEARQIISDEARERNERTAALKEARMARDALLEALGKTPSTAKKKKKK